MKNSLSLLSLVLLLHACSSPSGTGNDNLSQTLFFPWPTSASITAFCQDSQGYVWIGTEYGLNKYDGIQYRHYLNDDSDAEKTFFPYVRDIFCDSRGRIWVTSENGVDKMEKDDRFESFPVKNGMAWSIFENERQDVFINCYDEILRYDEPSGCLVTAIPATSGIACISPSGDIWVAGNESIAHYDKDSFDRLETIPVKDIPTKAFLDRDGILWMGHVHGLSAFSTRTGQFLDLGELGRQTGTSHIDLIKPYGLHEIVFISMQGDIWLYDDQTKTIRSRAGGNLPFTIPYPDSRISAFMRDGAGNVWIGTPDHSFVVGRSFGADSNPLWMGLYDCPVRSLYKDGEDKLWIVSTTEEVIRLDPETFRSETMSGLPQGLTASMETNARQARQSNLEIPFRHINFTVDDGNGFLWLGVLSTLVRMNKKDGSMARFSFSFQDADVRSQFATDAAVLLPGNRIAFGTNHGVVVFRTDKPLTTDNNLSFHIQSLSVSDNYILPGTESILREDIDYTDEVKLPPSARSIAINFTVLAYGGLSSYQYRYKMGGVDKEWQYSRPYRSASYAKIPFGRHVFEVEALSENGIDPDFHRQITFCVQRPWWLSIPAILFYILAFVLTVRLILYLLKQNEEGRVREALAANEKEQQKKLYERNMNMFANIAHEFRTPLTMISGAITSLTGKNVKPADADRMHSIILRNANRMLKLVGQLMDFNKLENNLLHLSVEHTLPVPIIQNIIDSFYFGAKQKDLTIDFDKPPGELVVTLDTDKFEKIIYNLMSNAVKFSTMGGNVNIRVSALPGIDATAFFPDAREREYLMVTVMDDGIGIPKEDLENVFERYFRTQGAEKELIGGTGIGLFMSRQLTLLHHGFLRAENRPDGQSGSIFRLLLPSVDEAYSPEEFKPSEETAVKETAALYTGEIITTPIQSHSEDKATVMIVDDDYEMLYFLRSLLSNTYNVVSFYNATTAYAAIEDVKPDLILSDVLMLEMDGYKFCQMVKENISTCHILFVLLTAKATTEDQVKGLSYGANAYVTKPFDPEYLLTLIKSQLSNAAILRDQLGRTTIVGDISDQVLGSKDKDFMTRLYAIMEEELTNPELNMTYVADKLMMSRTSLYYKIKQLTGESPVNVFKKYKLNRSLEMLKEGKLKISAIAETVGFSPSYFPKVFQEEFGILPSQYLKQQ